MTDVARIDMNTKRWIIERVIDLRPVDGAAFRQFADAMIGVLGTVSIAMERPVAPEPTPPIAAPTKPVPTVPTVPAISSVKWTSERDTALRGLTEGRRKFFVNHWVPKINLLPGPLVNRVDIKKRLKTLGLKAAFSEKEAQNLAMMRGRRTAKREQTPAADPVFIAPQSVPPLPPPVVVHQEAVAVGIPPLIVAPPQPAITRKEAMARVSAIATRETPSDRNFNPVLANFETVEAWAFPRAVIFGNWDDLPNVNRRRERLGLPPFTREFPTRGRRG